MKDLAPQQVPIDADSLRAQVRQKYRQVALDPGGDFHFHTGRRQALRLGYDPDVVAHLPDAASEAFAGVANPFALRRLQPGERVVDVGSGGGFDAFVAAAAVGDAGSVVGIDTTPEMLERARAAAGAVAHGNVEFREGLAEALPVGDAWADVVISNGVINLVADKRRAFGEIHRILRPGGFLQFADIANGRPVPEEAIADIDLWTA
ncbi:MAG: methyltransferase domain-containing protein [Actinobacteria bacterium]|nr:methyltransferase domain-containing protein [Actinomycetota bacterium]